MSDLKLTLKQLSCERDERVLFTNLSTEFVAGDIAQIIGANGAGKTTLLRIICGLSQHYQGEVHWCDGPNRGYDFLSALVYQGHAPGLNLSLTPLENLLWYFGLAGFKQSRTQQTISAGDIGDTELAKTRLLKHELLSAIKQALAQTGMGGYESVPCRMLSAGQQRRVALARLYCSKAPLWVLDEPFTAIDKSGVGNLQQLFFEHIDAGGMILLTSHQNIEMDNLRIVDLENYR